MTEPGSTSGRPRAGTSAVCAPASRGFRSRAGQGLLAATLGLMGCVPAGDAGTPIDAGDVAEWRVVDPVAVGLDAGALEALRAYAFRKEHHTQALLVVRHGYLAAEWYADGTDADTLATSWSVAKSFTATLVGMAIADGEIAGVDVPMSTFLPGWANSEKAPITLRDVLSMSSGLGWVEDYYAAGNEDGGSDIVALVLDPDPLAVVLDQPVRDPAGDVWTYSSGDTMLLGHALRQATSKVVADLAQERIARPLGMRELHWWQDATGSTYTFCCIDATPRDFAKFGQLYLQRGVWGGQQLLPATWVDAASAPQARANPGYGYQWWTNHPDAVEGNWPELPENTYFALGKDGQYVAVIPDLDMVVVRMGEYVVPDTDDWVAPDGLFAAGVISDGYGATGSRPPEGSWDEHEFFELVAAAVTTGRVSP